MTARSKRKSHPDQSSPRTGPPAPKASGTTPADRPPPPEAFEECAPTGGYGGAGMEEEGKEE